MSGKQPGAFSGTHWSEELWSRNGDLSTFFGMQISLELKTPNFWFKMVCEEWRGQGECSLIVYTAGFRCWLYFWESSAFPFGPVVGTRWQPHTVSHNQDSSRWSGKNPAWRDERLGSPPGSLEGVGLGGIFFIHDLKFPHCIYIRKYSLLILNQGSTLDWFPTHFFFFEWRPYLAQRALTAFIYSMAEKNEIQKQMGYLKVAALLLPPVSPLKFGTQACCLLAVSHCSGPSLPLTPHGEASLRVYSENWEEPTQHFLGNK